MNIQSGDQESGMGEQLCDFFDMGGFADFVCMKPATQGARCEQHADVKSIGVEDTGNAWRGWASGKPRKGFLDDWNPGRWGRGL